MTNPNVWIIQKNLEDFKKTISNIDKNSTNNFLYTNCISYFTIDNITMNTKNFNIVFYSEDINTFILFLKTNLINLKYIKEYLNQLQIKYHEINFKNGKEELVNQYPYSTYNEESKTKEIYVASNEQQLKALLEDSLNKIKNNKCTFYPIIDSSIMFGYSNNNDKVCEIDKIHFDGIISTKDKIIMLLKLKQENSIIDFSIQEVIKESNFQYNKNYSNKDFFKKKELKNTQGNKRY